MRILIVEDEKRIADSIKKGFEMESFAVDAVYDGETGFDLASSEKYDVIILDLMLPGINGLEICRKLREDEKVSTPILMLTAKVELDDRVKGLNMGADDYLSKPFEFDELLARIKALSRRPKIVLGSKLKVEDLELNTVNNTVKRDGKVISLSKKEYSLLEYLMRNKGKVLSKDMIIDKVWSFDDDVLPNTIEVYIGYLRKKIDKPFKDNKQLITTVRGFGYKIG
jgi:DNA-binding response OmpR family regulator